jgi:hypothetical protein
LVLEPTLDVNFTFDFFVFLLVFPAELDHFDTIDIAIDPVSDFEDFATATLAQH